MIATEKRNMNYWWVPILFGVIFIVTGIWILKAPADNFATITLIIGVIILVSGCTELFLTIYNRGAIPGWGYQLTGAIINLVIGLILVINPSILLKIITLFVAIWLIIGSIMIIMRSAEARQLKRSYWKWELILGVFLLLLAILLLWHPMIMGFTISVWTAMAFIILGIFRIAMTIRLKRMSARVVE